MNTDTFEGQSRAAGGTVKEAAGSLTGDRTMANEGRAEQVGGNLQESFGAARDAVGKSARPILDTVRQTARDKPIATYAAAGIFGAAILSALFGRKR